MKDLDYGKEYQYAHSYEGNFVNQEFLPNEISGTQFYVPGENATEKKNPAKNCRKKWGKIFLVRMLEAR